MSEFSPHIEQFNLRPTEGFSLFEQIFDTVSPALQRLPAVDECQADSIDPAQQPCFGF